MVLAAVFALEWLKHHLSIKCQHEYRPHFIKTGCDIYLDSFAVEAEHGAFYTGGKVQVSVTRRLVIKLSKYTHYVQYAILNL